MRALLVAHRLALLAAHVVLAAQHEEHAHAAPASLGHPQLLAHPHPPVEVTWRSDHTEREEQRLRGRRRRRRQRQVLQCTVVRAGKPPL